MSALDDPFQVLVYEAMGKFAAATPNPASTGRPIPTESCASIARFQGFDHNDQPLVVGAPGLPHEILAAQSTIVLRHRDIGSAVVLLFQDGNVRRPIIVGVVQDRHESHDRSGDGDRNVTIHADEDRFVVTAEREIILRCGDASITLTRAGKVIIKGTSIVSRASGHNKIKGAAVEIN